MVSAELGESKVPLVEDVIKKPKDYVKNWKEFATDNYEQIVAWNYAQNSTSTVYTVPKNYTLFITNISSCLHTTNAAALGDCTVYKTSITSSNRLMRMGAASHPLAYSSNQNFPMPIKLDAGESIFVQSNNANIVANCCIFGFLISKNII